jgi:DNA (cytosine-5)-methyltransferase 1
MAFNYVELFAGIGGFRQALDTLGGKCVFASEIDPFATKAYRALYDGATELHGDITKIDAHDIPDHDVLVGGFPCQAFSVAGQRKGFEEARGTLFFEIARIASAKQPRLMLLENVKGLLSHDGGNTFETMCAVLNDIGYAIDFRVLNSKHYGVPQNRERIFICASRDAEHADWNVSGNGVEAKAKRRAQDLDIRTFNFEWPTNDTVTTRLRDILESNVDERYYLSEEKTTKLIAQLNKRDDDTIIKRDGHGYHEFSKITPTLAANAGTGGNNMPFIIDTKSPDNIREYHDFCPTLQASDYKEPKQVVEPIVAGSLEHYGNDQMNRVYSVAGVAPTIIAVSGGGREAKNAEPIVENIGNVNPSGNGMNGSVYADSGLSPTLTTNKGEGVKVAIEYSRKTGIGRELEQAHCLSASDWRGLNRNQAQTAVLETSPRYRIRKLTPLECWRLQGFSDAAHETVKAAGVSDSQRYKQAGNAVTVNVISAIGKRLIPLLTQTNEIKTEVHV